MLSTDEIRRIAKLANLELTPAEIEKFSRELSDILDFFAKLQEVNTDGVEPTAQVTGLINVLRPDSVQDCECSPDLLKSSPNTITNDQISVPSVF